MTSTTRWIKIPACAGMTVFVKLARCAGGIGARASIHGLPTPAHRRGRGFFQDPRKCRQPSARIIGPLIERTSRRVASGRPHTRPRSVRRGPLCRGWREQVSAAGRYRRRGERWRPYLRPGWPRQSPGQRPRPLLPRPRRGPIVQVWSGRPSNPQALRRCRF